MPNPFQCGHPVTDDFFFGRKEELAVLDSRTESAAKNQLSDNYLFLSGLRAYGKTSILWQFAKKYAPRHNALCVNVTIGEKRELADFFEDVINQLFSAIDQQLRENRTLWGSLVQLFNDASDRIEGIQVAGLKVRWSIPKEQRSHGKASFLTLLPQIWKQVKEKTSFRALVITIDELDRFESEQYHSLRSDFAYAWKEISDSWRAHHHDVFVVVSCLVSVHDQLMRHQPSLNRHFDTISVGRFSSTETSALLQHSLQAGDPVKHATEPYVASLVQLSGGVPAYIQWISKIAFEKDGDGKLDRDDFLTAVPNLLQQVGGQFGAAVRQFKHLKHAVRVLRCLAAFVDRNIRRPELIAAVKLSFENGEYEYDEEYEVGEADYSGDTQVDNTLATLIAFGMVERTGRGIYRMTDPVCDCWVNHVLNGYSIEESVRRSK